MSHSPRSIEAVLPQIISLSVTYQCAHGYGSLLLKELLKIAKRQNVKQIIGRISIVDWSHVDKLKHFYEKHGFAVTLDSENLIKEDKMSNKFLPLYNNFLGRYSSRWSYPS